MQVPRTKILALGAAASVPIVAAAAAVSWWWLVAVVVSAQLAVVALLHLALLTRAAQAREIATLGKSVARVQSLVQSTADSLQVSVSTLGRQLDNTGTRLLSVAESGRLETNDRLDALADRRADVDQLDRDQVPPKGD